MSELIEVLYPVALFLVPAITLWRWTRRPQVTRWDVLVATAFAGLSVGLGVAILLLLDGAPFDVLLQLWPWMLLSAVAGVAIGLVGLLSRGIREWLSGAP